MAPLVLVPLFKNPKSGLKSAAGETVTASIPMIEPAFTWGNTENVLDLFQENLVDVFKAKGYLLLRHESEDRIFELAHEDEKDKIATLRREDKKLTIDCSQAAKDDVEQLVTEAQNKSVSLVSGFSS